MTYIAVVRLCCFRFHFEHFNYPLQGCYVFAAVVAIDVFLRSSVIVSTHRRYHVASKTGFKQDAPNPNPD